MTDDEQLVALLRAAASATEAPPAAFGHAEVVATSQRITRRRTRLAAGAAGLVLLAGIATAVAIPGLRGNSSQVTAAAPPDRTTTLPAQAAPAPAQPTEQPTEQALDAGPSTPGAAVEAAPSAAEPPAAAPAPESAPVAPGAPSAAPPSDTGQPAAGQDQQQSAKPGTAGSGERSDGSRFGRVQEAPQAGAAPAPSDDSCVSQQDPELRRMVEAALPEAAGAAEAPVPACKVKGERAVRLTVDDGGRKGVLTVVYTPPGGGASGASGTSASTASGGTVTVSVAPAESGGPAPFADRVDGVAKQLAAQL